MGVLRGFQIPLAGVALLGALAAFAGESEQRVTDEKTFLKNAREKLPPVEAAAVQKKVEDAKLAAAPPAAVTVPGAAAVPGTAATAPPAVAPAPDRAPASAPTSAPPPAAQPALDGSAVPTSIDFRSEAKKNEPKPEPRAEKFERPGR